MTKYEYLMGTYDIMEKGLSEKKKEFINSRTALKENLFCSFVNFVSNYLAGFHYFDSWSDELSGDEVYRERLDYEEALRMVIKRETDLSLSKNTCSEVLRYLEENRYNIKEN